MKFIIQSNFKKIRVNGKSRVDKSIQHLFDKQSQLPKNSPESEAADCVLAEAIWEKNRAIIIEQNSEMTNEASNLSRVKMWRIKQKICPKNEVTPSVSKMDHEGN